MRTTLLRSLSLALLCLAAAAAASRADEGMWTYDNPPLAALKARYGFEPPKDWLDHVRLASVRFMDGGSGSFVSADGLMITNHHVGLGCIQNVSSEGKDYVKTGFSAVTRAEEVACPGYEVNVLVSFEDVTARVQAKVTAPMGDAEAREARKAAIATIESECNAKTGLRCDVVTLYQGGEYQLYRYKKYTDVRLVFAPEQSMAFFGGDPDNFTFPRHDLDICLMRAYENGQAATPAAHLRWSTSGTKEGDLVFVSGNPGSTSRLETMARLEYLRDQALPFRLESYRRRLSALREYAARGPEERRRALELIFVYENSLKATEGSYAALLAAKPMKAKADDEAALRAKAGASGGDPWEAIAGIQKKLLPRALEARLVGTHGSSLLATAGQIVQYVAEVKKPNEKRLEEYSDARLDSLRNALLSPAPVHADLDQAMLAETMRLTLDKLGSDHPFSKALLGGRTPAAAAAAAVAGTKLADPAIRKSLLDGGEVAVAASTDSMIALARKLDPMVRETRRFLEEDVEAPSTRAMERIARERWKVHGKNVPPDATFTLRLSYGVVAGFPGMGTTIAPYTTYHGLFDRSLSHGGKEPWALPARWQEQKGRLDLATPLNFVSTNDIIGGNSGSPVVDRKGEFVGIIFDGNIESLAWDYYYDDERGRAVAVDARGIVEALRKVYGADALVRELTGR
jgi:hypothetical protein